MGKTFERALIVVLVLVLVATVGRLIVKQLDYHQGLQDYAQAQEIAGMPDLAKRKSATQEDMGPELDSWSDEALAALAEVDLETLRTINADVIGWICIPGTDLSYPLLQGEDNEYYLNHTWQRKRSSAGAVFLDYRSSLAASHALIYAHRMSNTTMFGTLKFYEDETFWEEHPSVYLVSKDMVGRYDIFAAFESSVSSNVYKLNLTEGKREEFLSWCLEQSVIDTGLTPRAKDRTICLSTCISSIGESNTRWVVLAALVDILPVP